MQFTEMRILAHVSRRVFLGPAVLALLFRHLQIPVLEINVLICDLKTRDHSGLKKAYSVDKAVRGFVSQGDGQGKSLSGAEAVRRRSHVSNHVGCATSHEEFGCLDAPADPAEAACICQNLTLGLLARPAANSSSFCPPKHVNQINKDTLQFYRLIPFTFSPTFGFLHSISYRVIRHLTFFSLHPTFRQS
jgi:hypothetical protein